MKANDSEEAIKERIRPVSISVTDAGVNAWSSNVPECKTRYVVAIFMFGDGVAARNVTIETVDDAGATTTIYEDVPMAPSQHRQFPEGRFDSLRPLLSVEGGGNLEFTSDAGTPTATVIWYDEP